MNLIQSITFIGSGNVATHLAKNFFRNGFVITEIYSKSLEKATLLASETKSIACNNIKNISDVSDVYIICIKDDFIPEIVQNFPFKNKLIVHTSGSISIDDLKGFDNYGIFYPLQTFSKEKEVNIFEVPFCIEANTKINEHKLIELGEALSENVYLINSEQRKKLHLAAVFACNFTNYMYQIANDITRKSDIDFDILKPLILETAKKIQKNTPKSMQTGPAKRKDEAVIKKHLELLTDFPEVQEIYRLITKNIIKNS